MLPWPRSAWPAPAPPAGTTQFVGCAIGRPPENPRRLGTRTGTGELVQLVMRSIGAEGVGGCAVWGISDDARAYCELSEGDAIGYAPAQNAEARAEAVLARPEPLDPVARCFQGGQSATIDHTPPERRPAARRPNDAASGRGTPPRRRHRPGRPRR